METSPQFFASLAKAQAEFAPIHRDKTVKVRMKSGGEYQFSYAPLESILASVLPSLNAQGFALVQQVEGEPQYIEDGPPRGEYIATVLYHEHGWISNRVRIIINEPGPQAYGSALTYARRYGVTLLLGVCADEDEDGNIANGNTATTVREKSRPVSTITPQGEAWMKEDQEKAKSVAEEFRKAVNAGNTAKVYDLNHEYATKDTFYIAVFQYLKAPERAAIKLSLERERKLRGELAPAVARGDRG